jgi:hypothetical protein
VTKYFEDVDGAASSVIYAIQGGGDTPYSLTLPIVDEQFLPTDDFIALADAFFTGLADAINVYNSNVTSTVTTRTYPALVSSNTTTEL